MKQDRFIAEVAIASGEAQSVVARTLSAVVEVVLDGVVSEGVVLVGGLGAFKMRDRAARIGRNPRTGEPIAIPASRSIQFVPGSALRHRLASRVAKNEDAPA